MKIIRIAYTSNVPNKVVEAFIETGISKYLDEPIQKAHLERFSNFGGGSSSDVIITIASELFWGGIVQPGFYDLLKFAIQQLFIGLSRNRLKPKSEQTIQINIEKNGLPVRFKFENPNDDQADRIIDKFFEYISDDKFSPEGENQGINKYNPETEQWEPNKPSNPNSNVNRYQEIRDEAKKRLSS